MTKRLFKFSLGTMFTGTALVLGASLTFGAAPNAPIPGHFVDATEKLGIHFRQQASPTSKKYLLEAMGSGVALFDYDNDGRLDIFFSNGARLTDPTAKGSIPKKDNPKYWNRLYHQKSDGTFEDVTERAGLSGLGYSTGVAVGDYDNDGFEDLYVAGYGRGTLYHNNGDGTFTDVTAAAGVAGSGWMTSAAWVDYDNDGRLDLGGCSLYEVGLRRCVLRASRKGRLPFLLSSRSIQAGISTLVSQRRRREVH